MQAPIDYQAMRTRLQKMAREVLYKNQAPNAPKAWFAGPGAER